MKELRSTSSSWEGAAERFRRLGEANRKATERWLQSLTIEKSIAVFEDLCRGAPELNVERTPQGHPIPLFRLWRT